MLFSILRNPFLKLIFFLYLFVLIFFPLISLSDINQAIKKSNTNVIFLRHALAPGYGDPEIFRLEECETQRNLDSKGIEQAKSIGDYLKINNIQFSEILSSEWCRCIDTAYNMDIGEWKKFEGLNSFFQNFSSKSKVLKKLNTKLKEIKSDELVLMITHQVVIYNITGISPPSGGFVLYNSFTKNALEFEPNLNAIYN